MSWKNQLIHVVIGILKRGNTILVSQRPKDKTYAGYWEFPGGKVERNETSEQALQREINEELGVTVSDANFWFSHSHAYPDKTVLLDIWLVDTFIGEPYGKEGQVLRWVNSREIIQLRLLEGNLSIMDKINELFEKEKP